MENYGPSRALEIANCFSFWQWEKGWTRNLGPSEFRQLQIPINGVLTRIDDCYLRIKPARSFAGIGLA